MQFSYSYATVWSAGDWT